MALEINTVGMVGLGKMVGQLARHLAGGGCDVVGYDLANGVIAAVADADVAAAATCLALAS